MVGLEYRLDGHRFVVEAKRIEGVLPGSCLLPQPGAPAPWTGWVRVRDRFWPVVDMGAWWLDRPTPVRSRSRILVALVPDGTGREHRAGFLVDCVWGVIRCRAEDFVERDSGRKDWPLVPRVVLDEQGLLHWVRWEELWGAGLGHMVRRAIEAGPTLRPRALRIELCTQPLHGGRSGLPLCRGQGDSAQVVAAQAVSLPGCWRTEGSLGSGQCPQLERVRNCTACAVFQAAAQVVLDALAPAAEPGSFEAWLSRPLRAGRSPATGVVVFALDGEWWAVPARHVAEITGPLAMHRLPRLRPGAVCGLVQWRGAVIPCLSLRWMLGREDPVVRCGGAAGPWVMIAQSERGPFAWPVDQLVDVVRVGMEQIQEAPVTLSGSIGRSTCGMFRYADRWVGLLDWDRASGELEIEWTQDPRRQIGR
ncbi:chemotaxis protein CheW [Limisphaera sp. VF-2]|uniref:chemotaxis protein CheW n=1 Tax=Limisphaera sp. VF-2 TaxID=3400418 RepID=UPI00175F6487